MSININFYNSCSSNKLGWNPTWFGVFEFDEDLTKAIKKWQKNHNLKADGLVGPMTFRRIFTERETNIDTYIPKENHSPGKHIIYNSEAIFIDWPVVLWTEKNGLKCEPGSYKPQITGKRDISFFVNHWDVCLSSASCAKVLKRRDLSVHWCIDNDGVIYQLIDANHIAYHAGSKKWNSKSVGVEISNAYYTKYDWWYEKHGFGKRPRVHDARVHGRTLEEHLGFYPVQISALAALLKGVSQMGVPLEVPLDSNGELVTAVDKRCKEGKFKGIINHYNLTNRKIDCAGLDLKSLVNKL